MSTPAPVAAAPGSRLRRMGSRFLRPHLRAILWSLVGMLVQSMLLLPIPLLQGRVLDRLVARSDHDATARAIVVALAATAACLIGRMALAWKFGALMSRVGLEVARELTDAMHRKLQRLPMAYFDRRQTGSLMARLTDDVGSLPIFLNAASLQLASNLVLAAGIAAVLAALQWRLALACLAVVPLAALNHALFSSASRELARRTREQVASIYALLSERL